MWMNESEINRAIEQFAAHPVLGKAARFLGAFRDEVNAHSDGWAYWQLAARAADKLMILLNGHLFAGMGAYPRLPEPTDADLKKALAPIKAFYTRAGYKAGLKFPLLDAAKADNRGTEFDLHVWAKPATDTMTALYTVSIGQRAVCADLPLDRAVRYIRNEMETASRTN